MGEGGDYEVPGGFSEAIEEWRKNNGYEQVKKSMADGNFDIGDYIDMTRGEENQEN